MTSSHSKFLRRVRIHDGECGAVARALHHKVKGSSLYRADLEKASRSTTERKSMSTKTSTLKRIAQTAVVALVGGLLSTVVAAPASNAAVNSSISATCIAREGVGGVIRIAYNGDSTTVLNAAQTSRTLAAGGSYTLQTDIVSTRTDSASSVYVLPLSADTITSTAGAGTTINYLVWADRDGTNSTAGNAQPTLDPVTHSATVTCTVAGAPASVSLSSSSASIASGETVTVTATPKDSAGVTTLLKANESFTVSAHTTTTTARINIIKGTPRNAALTLFNAGAAAGAAQSSNAYADTLGSFEQGTVDRAEGAGTATASSTNPTARVTLSYYDADSAPSDPTGAGSSAYGGTAVAYLNGQALAGMESMTATGGFTFAISATGASTVTTTVRGAGTIASTVTAAHTLTVGTAGYATQWTFGASTSTGATTRGSLGVASSAYGAVPGLVTPTGYGSKTFSIAASSELTADAATYYLSTDTGKTVNLKLHSGDSAATVAVTVAARTGVTLPTGITASTLNYTTVGDGTETSVVVALAATAPLPGQGYDVSWKANATTTYTLSFTYEAPTVNSSKGTITTNPAALTGAKNAVSGSNSVEVTVRDQFYALVSGATTLMTITGRNAVTSSQKSTDSFGKATYTWTDAGAVLTGSGATGTTDTVAISAQTSNATSALSATSIVITYSATLTAGTLTMTNDGAATGVAAGSCVTYTATALDASGIALLGYPVVFTGTNAYFSAVASTTTVYSSSAGVASASFCGKLTGSASITATTGGKSATSTHTVIAGSARVLSVDATTASMAPGETKRVVATLKDTWGNIIADGTVTVAYSGTAGRVASVNGVSSSSCTTNASGQCTIEIGGDSAGTGTLTLSFTGGNTSTAATLGDGSAQPARVASVTTAVTIAGKSATIAAIDAAQAAADAATDAALEAIDAANAATDAANLSAEAADAATVAAEEARDAADAATAAVEALATEVATLMAALKAQITTLANTVAKIAKKVKA